MGEVAPERLPVPDSKGSGVVLKENKDDQVLDLMKDEKLKVQLEIRKLASDLKKEVTNSSAKKTEATEAIAKMDKNFDTLIHTGSVEKSTLDSIKKETLTDYVKATISPTPDIAKTTEADKTVIDKTIDNVNKLNIKKDSANQDLTSTPDADSAARVKAVRDQEIANKKIVVEKDIEASLNTIDTLAEAEYKQWKPDKQMTKEQANIAFTGFASNVAAQIDNQLLTVEEQTRMGYRFELNHRQQEIITSQAQKTTGMDTSTTTPDSSFEISDQSKAYKAPYENTPYDVRSKEERAKSTKNQTNIYDDKDMKKVMNTILDKPNMDAIKNSTFGVNLTKKDGLGHVVDTLATMISDNKFSISEGKIQIIDNGVSRPITGEDLKTLQHDKKINYVHEKGILQIFDNEWNKLAKILNNAEWKDLQTFSGLLDVRSGFSAVKEYSNAKESGLLTPATMWDFLCDRNGDGVLSYNASEQKNLGDIGNIFGQQLRFSIKQAIDTEEVLHPGKGENKIIHNIMVNVDTQAGLDTKMSPELKSEIAKYAKFDYCTSANLYTTLGTYPEFKVFFGAAIEKINGSPNVLSPNLTDTLRGDSLKKYMESKDWELNSSLETKIDEALKANAQLSEYLKTHNIVELRQNIISQIMNLADGLTIVGSNSQEGNIANPGVSKEFVNQRAKREFINDLTNKTINSLAVGIYNPKDGIRIPIDFIKQGHSENGRTLWKINGGPSLGYNQANKDLIFTLGIGGEVAEQYNYNHVINADLNDVKSAKYLGGEAQAIASTSILETSAGLNWQKDPIMGINQINRQYETVSKTIFTLGADDLKDYTTIAKKIETNIANCQTVGKYKDFVHTNKDRLTANATFVCKFLEANNALQVLPANKKLEALNGLISIIQEGNMEQWRSDLLTNMTKINGKTDITKLSFGVTSNMITIGHNANTGDNRFGLAGFYVGARMTNWQTQYHVNDNQLVNTRRNMAEGKGAETIQLKTPDQYAKYIKAVFNTGELDIATVDKKIVITNKSKIPLDQFLNIRMNDAGAKQVQYTKNKDGQDELTIGDVKAFGAYTIAEADGVVRTLCIGTKKLQDAKIIDLSQNKDTQTRGIENADVTETRKPSKTDITPLATDVFKTNSAEQSKLLSCLDDDGNFVATPDVTIKDGAHFAIGKEIVFSKGADGKYTISSQEGTPGKLGLRFVDGKTFESKKNIEFKSTEKTNAVDFVPKDLPIKAAFAKLAPNDYAKIDTNNPKSFIKFMNAAKFDIARTTLIKMLPKTTKFTEIRAGLQNTSDAQTQHYIVDQFKGLFAYEASYSYPTKSMDYFYKRGNVFLEALNTKDANLNTELLKTRQDLLAGKTTETYDTKKRESVPNLFGFTTFYKKNVTRQASLVSAGDTKVMPVTNQEGKKQLYTPISKLNQDTAKQWIVNNLNQPKYESEKAMLIENIKQNMKDVDISGITDKNFDTLLTTGEVILDNSLKKIILKSRPVFYFKAECVNESLGLVIDGIDIQESPQANASISAATLDVDVGTHSVAAHAEVERKDVNVKGNIDKEAIAETWTKIKSLPHGGKTPGGVLLH